MIIEFPKVRRRAPQMQDQVLKSFSGITAAVQPGGAFAAMVREERRRAERMAAVCPKIALRFLLPPKGVLLLGTIAKIGEQA